MVYSVKYQTAFWVYSLVLCTNYAAVCSGPVTKQFNTNRAYLPPVPEALTDHTEAVLKRSSSMVNIRRQFPSLKAYTTSYKTNHNSRNFLVPGSQVPEHKPAISHIRRYHNSYAPQPSGRSLPQPPTAAPLPSLSSSFVLQQLASASATTFPSPSSTKTKQTMALFPVEFLSSKEGSKLDNRNNFHPKNGFTSQSIIMIDTPMEIIKPSLNQTSYVAKLLESALLHATGSENPEEFMDLDGFKANQLSASNVLVLKTQKNAYIVPNDMPPMAIGELYNMRNELQKAYTVNQFVFIIKPEHINFLNKLV